MAELTLLELAAFCPSVVPQQRLAAQQFSFLPSCAGGRKRKAGKLQKALPWEQAAGSDSEGGIPARAGGYAADALATNGVAHSPGGDADSAPAPVEEDAQPPADEGLGYVTPPAGGSPARPQAELEALLAGVLAEGEDSSPGMLSPGGLGLAWLFSRP